MAELEEEEEVRQWAEGLEEGALSSVRPPLRFFTAPNWCSKTLPLPCPCSPESPTQARLWELVVGEGSPRGGCVRLQVQIAFVVGEWASVGEGWGWGLLLGESVPLVCPCAGALEDKDDALEGGRPLSWRTMQFLSGPECSPSWDGTLRLRRTVAAATCSRSFNICLLGRPTGFLGRPGLVYRVAAGAP